MIKIKWCGVTAFSIMMLLIICLIFGLSFNGLSFSKATPKRIIVDVDAGVDDYHALVFLLEAHYHGQIKIEAITCSDGNTKLENVEKNVMRLLEIVGKTDIPVYSGSFHSIIALGHSDLFFGQDGFGDLTYNKQPNVTLIRRDLITPVYINNLIKTNPRKITIVTLGPMTNIALTLIMFPDAKDQIKELYSMGGNYKEIKNEFNFKFDPESVNVTLKLANFPITILPWRGCLSQKIPMSWRFGLNISNYVWNVLERAERNIFGALPPNKEYKTCDSILAAVFLDNTIITDSVEEYATMELHNSSRGQLFMEDDSVKKNVRFVTNFDLERFKNRFVKTFENICDIFNCNNYYE